MNVFCWTKGSVFQMNAANGVSVKVPAGSDKSELLSVIAKGLEFPAYFGQNFDALSECLADLSWLSFDKISISHEDVPLTGADTTTYLNVLADAVREQGGRLTVSFPDELRDEVAAHL